MKLKLNLQEVQTLFLELNDLRKQNISFPLKYDFDILQDKMEPIVKAYNDNSNAIIVKYGKKIEGGHSLVGSKKAAEGFSELEKLIMKEEEIELPKLTTEDFKDVKSDYNYKVVFKFLTKKNNK